ncbi:hypothetical protein [Aeromonas phage 4L372XY]|uniref:Uncharacterized protein n=1 Tax=Aeromonas phage 4L372XY TaxID=2588520 RepID=A0A5B9N3W9_9CAUD|nr:nucleotide pyrophosphohydrolase [Aeromonas phage 4L372XY]QEG08867.1 hypothetical protein [Aeromonas phage 4L372XY]
MNFENKTEFLNSLVKKEDEIKKALTKLYQGVRATNKFLGLENSPELQDTYYKLRIEECSELFTAIENEDKVEFLDAVVDGLVVVGYEYFLKYKEPDFDKYEEIGKGTVLSILEQIEYTYNRTRDYDDTLGYLEMLFNIMDINHMKAVNEVLESNWSKFPTVTEFGESSWWSNVNLKCNEKVKLRELLEYQIAHIEKQGRYVDVYHELRYDESVGEDRVIFWSRGEEQADGSIKEFKAPKYVKPCTFKEPDFASCWLN